MIDLTGLTFASISPELMEFGGIQRGSLGGPSQQLNRLGNRWSFALALPPVAAINDWTAKIVAAKQEGALIRIVEPGYNRGPGGDPVVSGPVTIQGGTSVPIAQLTPNFLVESKWVSFIHGGVRYVHLITAPVVANGSGYAVVTITPMLRTPLTPGDVVEIGSPKAQGLLVDQLSWTVDSNRLITHTLTLEERL